MRIDTHGQQIEVTPALRDYVPWVYTGLAILVCIYFLSASVQNLRSFLTTLVIALIAIVKPSPSSPTLPGSHRCSPIC